MEKQTKVIVNTNQKGGVGKTTTTASMMAGLKKKGFKVLGIDLDSQCNLSYVLKADPKKNSIKDVFRDDCDITEAIQETSFGDLIQSNKGLDNAMHDLDAIEQVYKLRNVMTDILGDYDYVIIDTPPALSPLTVNALVAADYVVIPVQGDSFSLQGAEALAKTINKIKTVNQKLVIAGILLVRYKSKELLSKLMTDQFTKFANLLQTKVYKTTIREGVAVKESQLARVNIFEYENGKSGVAEDYNTFINELLEDING